MTPLLVKMKLRPLLVKVKLQFFSAKHWDSRSREDLIESANPCYDAQVVGLCRGSNSLCLIVLAEISEFRGSHHGALTLAN